MWLGALVLYFAIGSYAKTKQPLSSALLSALLSAVCALCVCGNVCSSWDQQRLYGRMDRTVNLSKHYNTQYLLFPSIFASIMRSDKMSGCIGGVAALFLLWAAPTVQAVPASSSPALLPSHVPIIDAAVLFNNSNELHVQEQGKLRHALAVTGFLVLRNSDISAAVVDDVISAYREFFSQGTALKSEVDMSRSFSNRGWGHPGAERVSVDSNADYKEFFDRGIDLPKDDPRTSIRYYAPNLWPHLDNFKDTLDSYFSLAHDVSRQLLSAVAACLGQSPEFFEPAFADAPMSLMRGIHYPPRPSWATEIDFGIAPHTDYGCVTLVVSDGTPGLEVLTGSEEWTAVTPAPGDIVVNFGEMLEMWSGGHVKATLHKVRGSESERFSSAFFFNPSYNTDITPFLSPITTTSEDMAGTMAGGNSEYYHVGRKQIGIQSVRAGEYLSKRYDDTYVHLARDKKTTAAAEGR